MYVMNIILYLYVSSVLNNFLDLYFPDLISQDGKKRSVEKFHEFLMKFLTLGR